MCARRSHVDRSESAAPAHVLVVDDEPDIVELAHWLLEHEGHRVSTAHNGVDAIASALADPPDLVLLDVTMPAMSGIDVALALRRHPHSPRMVIVIHSAMEESWVLRRFAAYDHFLAKPCASEGLVACVANALGGMELPLQRAGNRH